MTLSSYVWFSHYGWPHWDKKFPYKRQSPTTSKVRVYKNQDHVMSEIDKIYEKQIKSKYTLGRNLYFTLPLFCDPKCLFEDWVTEVVKEFRISKELNIPLARSLDEADSFMVDNFLIIENELNSIREYESSK